MICERLTVQCSRPATSFHFTNDSMRGHIDPCIPCILMCSNPSWNIQKLFQPTGREFSPSLFVASDKVVQLEIMRIVNIVQKFPSRIGKKYVKWFSIWKCVVCRPWCITWIPSHYWDTDHSSQFSKDWKMNCWLNADSSQITNQILKRMKGCILMWRPVGSIKWISHEVAKGNMDVKSNSLDFRWTFSFKRQIRK